jgi:hypothetical protein
VAFTVNGETDLVMLLREQRFRLKESSREIRNGRHVMPMKTVIEYAGMKQTNRNKLHGL